MATYLFYIAFLTTNGARWFTTARLFNIGIRKNINRRFSPQFLKLNLVSLIIVDFIHFRQELCHHTIVVYLGYFFLPHQVLLIVVLGYVD